ncbi:hypothetical protein J6590_071819 [Homalodisca vitripennis]|nr:hypothetical protein J6590_071819 [Homalodisca vitripennis]
MYARLSPILSPRIPIEQARFRPANARLGYEGEALRSKPKQWLGGLSNQELPKEKHCHRSQRLRSLSNQELPKENIVTDHRGWDLSQTRNFQKAEISLKPRTLKGKTLSQRLRSLSNRELPKDQNCHRSTDHIGEVDLVFSEQLVVPNDNDAVLESVMPGKEQVRMKTVLLLIVIMQINGHEQDKNHTEFDISTGRPKKGRKLKHPGQTRSQRKLKTTQMKCTTLQKRDEHMCTQEMSREALKNDLQQAKTRDDIETITFDLEKTISAQNSDKSRTESRICGSRRVEKTTASTVTKCYESSRNASTGTTRRAIETPQQTQARRFHNAEMQTTRRRNCMCKDWSDNYIHSCLSFMLIELYGNHERRYNVLMVNEVAVFVTGDPCYEHMIIR